MAYAISDILIWAAAAQPLAAHGEAKRQYTQNGTVDLDLHKKIYIERKSLDWQYQQNPTDTDGILFQQGNYVYALLFPYLFEAQQATGGGGQVVNPTTPGFGPTPYQFEVSTTSFIAEGDLVKVFPSAWVGRDILFIRNAVPQGTVVLNQSNYYSWDSTTATLTLFGPPPPDGNNGAATETEQFQIFPV